MAINGTTSVFFLETVDDDLKDGFKRFYPGTDMLTKHFLLSSIQEPKVFRHYTTCNAMNPPVYAEYIRALNYAIDNDGLAPLDFKNEILDSEPSEFAMFTIKNYNNHGGISIKVHDED